MLVFIVLISGFILFVFREKPNAGKKEKEWVTDIKIASGAICVVAAIFLSALLIVYGTALSADENIDKLLKRNDVITEELQPKIATNIEYGDNIGLDSKELDAWSQELWTEYQRNLQRIEAIKGYKENISIYRWWINFGIF